MSEGIILRGPAAVAFEAIPHICKPVAEMYRQNDLQAHKCLCRGGSQ